MNTISKSLLFVLMISLFSLTSLAVISSFSNQSVLGVSTIIQSLLNRQQMPIPINNNTFPCDEIIRLQKQYCSIKVPTPTLPISVVTIVPQP